MHDTLLYLVLSAVAGSLLVSWLSSRPNLSKFPVINPPVNSKWGFRSSADQNDFLQNARALIKQGIDKFQKPFILNVENNSRIVLPPVYADAVKNDPRLSFDAMVHKDFFADFPGFEAIKAGNKHRIVLETVRIKLTQSLGGMTRALLEEATDALDSRWGNNPDWHTIDLGDDILYLVAHLSARVFLGEELSHNEEWLKISIDYTLIIFNAARALRLWPAALRPVAVWFIPECRKLRATTRRARAIVQELVDKREALRQQAGYGRINDALEWMREVANGRSFDVAGAQLGMTMAAIHTTTDLTKQVLLDLAQHPALVEDIRAEVSEVLKTSGWEKTSLYKMKLLDSAIKETQRMKPAGITSMQRLVLEDMTLPDGTVLPKGSEVLTSAQRLWDADVHDKPDHYDGARFLKMRQEPGRENTGQLVTVSSDHIAFGYGKHACPGRFFAANEVKISVAYMLMNYDLRLVDATAAEPMPYGMELIVNPSAKLEVRRRAA